METIIKKHLVRLFDPEKDYSIVSKWWKSHGWDAVPLNSLSPLSVIYEYNGEAKAFATCYLPTGCNVSIMEFFVKDPTMPGKGTVYAAKHIINFLKSEAVDNDYDTMLTTCKQPSLASLYEKNGFNLTDKNMIHLHQSLR